MQHLPETELARMIKDAEALVVPGARYAHYKHPDQAYQVTGFGIREDTQEISVIYVAEYGEHIPFIRTLASFIESVEQNGRSVPRFTRLA